MKEIEQLLSYLLTCPGKDPNKNTIWKRFITLDLVWISEYQKILLQPLHYLIHSWSISDCITSWIPIVIKNEVRKKLQKLIRMKDFCSLIPPSICSDTMYHSISGVSFFNYWCLIHCSKVLFIKTDDNFFLSSKAFLQNLQLTIHIIVLFGLPSLDCQFCSWAPQQNCLNQQLLSSEYQPPFTPTDHLTCWFVSPQFLKSSSHPVPMNYF